MVKFVKSVPELFEYSDNVDSYTLYARAELYAGIYNGSPAWLTNAIEILSVTLNGREVTFEWASNAAKKHFNNILYNFEGWMIIGGIGHQKEEKRMGFLG